MLIDVSGTFNDNRRPMTAALQRALDEFPADMRKYAIQAFSEHTGSFATLYHAVALELQLAGNLEAEKLRAVADGLREDIPEPPFPPQPFQGKTTYFDPETGTYSDGPDTGPPANDAA